MGLSLMLGLVIYWNSAVSGQTTREKATGLVLAVVNSFAIAAAALGIETITTP